MMIWFFCMSNLQYRYQDMILKTVIYDGLVFCKNNLQYRYYIYYLMIDNNHQKNNQNSIKSN